MTQGIFLGLFHRIAPTETIFSVLLWFRNCTELFDVLWLSPGMNDTCNKKLNSTQRYTTVNYFLFWMDGTWYRLVLHTVQVLYTYYINILFFFLQISFKLNTSHKKLIIQETYTVNCSVNNTVMEPKARNISVWVFEEIHNVENLITIGDRGQTVSWKYLSVENLVMLTI